MRLFGFEINDDLGAKTFLTILSLIFSLTVSSQTNDDDWKSIGTGQLIDGWVIGTILGNEEKYPLDVEIQEHKRYADTYRIKNPYSKLEDITGIINISEYKDNGAIIFNVTDPGRVIFEMNEYPGFANYQKPNGQTYFNGILPDDEVYVTDIYSYGVYLMGESMADFFLNMFQGSEKSTFYFDEEKEIFVVDIKSPGVTNIGVVPSPTGGHSKIYFPKSYGTTEATNWTFMCDFDAFDFKIDNEPVDCKFDNSTKSYSFENVWESSVLYATLKEQYAGFEITDIVSAPQTDSNITVNEAKDGFSIEQQDFQGDFTFTVSLSYPNVTIIDLKESWVSTEKSGSIILTFHPVEVPDGASFKVLYGTSSDNLTEVADASDSRAAIKIDGLQPDTDYEYYVCIAIYYNDIEIYKSETIAVKFRTGKPFDIDTDVKASDYLWDSHTLPDNRFSIFCFTGPIQYGKDYTVWASGGPWNIHGRQIRTGMNENGFYELNMILSHLTISHDREKFIIHKYNVSDEDKGYLYYPVNDGVVGKIEPESGKRYELNKLNEDQSWIGDDFAYFMVGDETDHGYHLESGYILQHKMIYNVLVKLEFEDEDFNDPVAVTFDFEEAPVNNGKPVFTGSLAQTSRQYADAMVSVKPDNYGGWATYVPFESVDGGYPYSYTFTPNKGDTEYDFSVFINIIPPADTPKQGAALMAAEKTLYPYLSFWSDEFENTTSFWNESDHGVRDIKHDLGVSKPFPGSFGSDYRTATSIHLTGLEEGKVYRLTLSEPSFLWWFHQYQGETDDDASRYYVGDVAAWISLVEYTPELKSYQLVKNLSESETEKDGDVYYTFDTELYNSSSGAESSESPVTYRIVMDGDASKIVSCEKLNGINENNAYIEDNYLFTDLLFVRTVHPDWMLNNDVDVEIADVSGSFLHNGQHVDVENHSAQKSKTVTILENNYYKKNINRHSEPGFSYFILKMKDKDTPFSMQNYTLEEGYTYNIQTSVEIEYEHLGVKYLYDEEGNVLRDKYGNAIYEVVRSDSKENAVVEVKPLAFPEGNSLNNKAVGGTGHLVIPTPASQPVQYSFNTDDNVEAVDDNTVTLRFYASDLLSEGNDHLDMEYSLPALKIHSHNYNITFPYYSTNTTEDLDYTVLNGEGDGQLSDNPAVRFRFIMTDDDASGESSMIYSSTDGTGGHFDVDMGAIYKTVVEDNGQVVRKVNLQIEKADGTIKDDDETPFIYNRWNEGNSAVTAFTLNAPVATLNAESEKEAGLITSNMFHHIISTKTENDVTYSKEALMVTGLSVKNTPDNIADGGVSNNRNLMTGDNIDNATTLYLVEYKWDSEERIELVTAENLKSLMIPLECSDWFDSSENWGPGAYKIDEKSLKKTYQPIKIRNVYLFPNLNEDLTTDEDDEGPSEMRNKVRREASAATNLYHAVTTPYVEPVVDLTNLQSDAHLSGIVDATVYTSTLATARKGTIEIHVEDARLFNAEGVLIALGKGEVAVAPGYYLVCKDNLVQRLIVR